MSHRSLVIPVTDGALESAGLVMQLHMPTVPSVARIKHVHLVMRIAVSWRSAKLIARSLESLLVAKISALVPI